MKKILLPFFIILFSVSLFAQMKVSGDFRVRPRYDIRDAGKYGNYQQDYYYMYRARINIRFDIGEGWFFKTQLGHNGFGGYDFTTYLSQNRRIPIAVEGANRPSVHFMQLYYGKKTKNWGIIGGIIPIGSFSNPLYDAHYYPTLLLDVPYVLFSADAAFGFDAYIKMGPGKLGLRFLADHNDYSIEDKDGKKLADFNDGYTIAANYTVKIKKFTIQPMLMYTFAPDNYIKPLTYGINITSPKLGKTTFGASFLISKQDNKWFDTVKVAPIKHKPPYNVDAKNPKYDIYQLRLKMANKISKKVSSLVWVDFAKRTDKFDNREVEHNYFYIWAMLNYTVFKSDKGSVVISPTVRIKSEKVDNMVDALRSKYEISTTISF